MSVYGNDGAIYIDEKKEIFHVEAKFYSNLNEAITRAVDSLENHNRTKEDLTRHAELFRNMQNHKLGDLIIIEDNVKESLILFLVCDDIYNETDILAKINTHKKLEKLISNFNVILFVVPILDKKSFLDLFKMHSDLIGAKYYGNK